MEYLKTTNELIPDTNALNTVLQFIYSILTLQLLVIQSDSPILIKIKVNSNDCIGIF